MKTRIAATLLAAATLAGTSVAGTANGLVDPTELDANTEISGLAEVFFAFDSARLPETTDSLSKVVEWAKANPSASIVVDGHADATGAADYNVGLALRRAGSVQSKLIALGVAPARILVVTYGEDGLRRTSQAMDRRVTVWATEAPLYAVIDRSLLRGTAIVWREPVSAAELEGPSAPEVAAR